MRVMFSSNAWWANTGYAIPVRNLIPRFQEMGHEVANFAWYGLQGAKLDAGVQMYPALPDQSELSTFGANCIGAHAADFAADVVISVQDIWALPSDYAERVKSKRPGCKWVCWTPVDHDPVPEIVVERALTTDVAAVYSEWGARLLQDAGVEQARYVPLGVDTSVFYPRDRRTARRALGWPEEAFIAAMVAANKADPSRKAYPEQLSAFQRFAQNRDAAYLYVHCDWTRAQGGVSVPTIADSLGIRKRMLFVDRYKYAMGLPEDYLANVYSAANVLLAASQTEGFGMPILEAQACGCPVITTQFSSMPELTWNGITVPAAQLMWTPLQSWVAVPDVDGIWAALESVAMWDEEMLATEAIVGVECAQSYTWGIVAGEYWAPLLGDLEAWDGRAGAAREARVPDPDRPVEEFA